MRYTRGDRAMRSNAGRATRFTLTTIALIIVTPLAVILLSNAGLQLGRLAQILLR
jgi:hypothetical protein